MVCSVCYVLVCVQFVFLCVSMLCASSLYGVVVLELLWCCECCIMLCYVYVALLCVMLCFIVMMCYVCVNF